MIAISAAWLDPLRERPIFEAYPLLTPLLPRLQETHDVLMRFEQRGTAGPVEANIRQLTAALLELDGAHDRVARGIHAVLTGLADLSEDASSQAVLLDVRDDLLPSGLRETQRTYLEQSGNLRRVREHVLTARLDVLRTVPLPAGDTLADAVAGWAEIGLEFERLDAQRRELQRSLQQVEPAVSLLEVRIAWVRLANAVLAAAELERLPVDAQTRLLGPLREAEGKADRLLARRRAAPVLDLDDEDPAEPAQADAVFKDDLRVLEDTVDAVADLERV